MANNGNGNQGRVEQVTGVVIDAVFPEELPEIYSALKNANPALRLWSVVYTHELNPEDWAG